MRRLLLKIGGGILLAMLLTVTLVLMFLGHSLSLRFGKRVVERTRGGMILICRLLDKASSADLETKRQEIQDMVGMPVVLVDENAPELAGMDMDSPFCEPSLHPDSHGRYSVYARLHNHPKVLRLGPVPWKRVLALPDILIILGLALAVGLLVALFLVAPMAKRVADIEHTASDLAAGRLDARVQGKGGDLLLSRLADHVNHMADRIQALVESQRTVLERVSHDMRTPISRIRFNLEMLPAPVGAPEDGARMDAKIEAISQDLDEMDRLVAEILKYARLRSAAQPLECQPVPVTELARNMVTYLPSFQQEGKTLEVVGDETVLQCDENALRRCLQNLLSNALRHASSRILVRIQDQGHHVIVSVEDDGPGVPPEDRDRLFEPFVSLTPKDDSTGPGIGLGLAVVTLLVQAHGGDVTLTDSALGGARFVIK